jgi:hypothetical protein
MSFFFGLKFCTDVKNKYEKRIFDHFFKEKLIRFLKIKNHVVTFGYWFSINFLNV